MSSGFQWILCGVLGFLFTCAGCGQSPEEGFVLPAFVSMPLAEARQSALADIDAHRSEVDTQFEALQKIPKASRYQLFAGEKPYLWSELLKENQAYLMQRTIAEYLAHTIDREAAREAAIAFIKADVGYSSGVGVLSQAQLMKLGLAAREAGSGDLLVRFAQLALDMDQSEGEKLKAILKLKSEFQKSKLHPLHRARFANWIYYLTQRQAPNSDMAHRRLFEAIDAYMDYLEADSKTTNPRLLWMHFSRFFLAVPESEQQYVVYALWENNKVDPWLCHLSAGIYLKNLAYNRRGTRFSANVTDTQWAGMHEAGQMADEHLLRAWQMAPNRPEPATELISLAMSGETSRGDISDWFFEAVRAQADWESAYSAYRYALTPRWNGSHPHMLGFAAQCIRTKRYDTFVPGVTIDILKQIEKEVGSLEDLMQMPGVPELSKEFEDGLKQAIDQGGRCPSDCYDNWGYLVRHRVLAGDFPTARLIYEKYGKGQLGLSVLGANGLKSSYVRGLTFASTGPAQDDVSAFESFLNKSFNDDVDLTVLDEIEEVLKESLRVDVQPESQAYYSDIAAVLQHLRTYHNDEWVELKFDKRLSGIYAEAATVTFLPDGELRMSSSDSRLGIQLRPMAHFRPPFVCEAEVSLGSEDQPAQQSVGLIYGTSDRRALYARQPLRAIYKSYQSEMVSVFDRENPQRFRGAGWLVRSAPFHHLRVIVLPHSLEMQADRESVCTIQLPEGAVMDRFSVGEMLPADKASNFRVRNVRIKRLRMGDRPAVSATLDQQWKFATQMRDIDPLSPTGWFTLGEVQRAQGDHAAAVESFGKYVSLTPLQKPSRLPYAESLLEVRRLAEAEKEFLIVLSQDANQMDANSGIAWIYATAEDDKLRDGQKAFQHAKLACDLAKMLKKDAWRALLSLAVAYAELGQFPEAQQQIEQSLAVAPVDMHEFIKGIQAEIAARRAPRTHAEASSTKK